MAKQSKGKSHADKARKRLTKAQLDLHIAQEKRAQAVARAQAEVESARLRAAAWVEKATQRVERRAGDLARAEARLLSATAAVASVQSAPSRPEKGQSGLLRIREPVRQVVTPHDAEWRIGQGELGPRETADADPIVLPDGLTSNSGLPKQANGEPNSSGTILP